MLLPLLQVLWVVRLSRIAGIVFGLLLLSSASAEVYRYQDADGRWVFTDRPPQSQTDVEQVQLQTRKVTAHAPVMTQSRVQGQNTVTVQNIFHAPIQIYLKASGYSDKPTIQVLQPLEEVQVLASDRPLGDVEFYWFLGRPDAKVASSNYAFPVDSFKASEISQAFHGRFSHQQEPNTFAVDIAADIGDDVVAARDGIVAWVKDDYHLGAASQFFIDKANYIYVLHDDGSVAVYAHILKGSARVKPGDEVRVGQMLAKIGNSGYSTGPHLHFVIWRNDGLAIRSVPFMLVDQNGTAQTPKTGMFMSR